MQPKANQKTYYCPYCEKKMSYEVTSKFGTEVHLVHCKNENCDVYDINWDLKKLESFEINKIARVEDLLEI